MPTIKPITIKGNTLTPIGVKNNTSNKVGTFATSIGPTSLGDVLYSAIPGGTPLVPTVKQYGKEYLDSLKPGASTGLRFLQDLGETLDVLANPVKAAVADIQTGDYGKNLYKATVGTKEGRTQYDWDTGNMLLNFGAEVVSDPLNWASFGLSSGGKLVADGLSETAQKSIKPLSKTASKYISLANKANIEDLAKLPNVTKVTTDAVIDAAKNKLPLKNIFRETVKQLSNETEAFSHLRNMIKENLEYIIRHDDELAMALKKVDGIIDYDSIADQLVKQYVPMFTSNKDLIRHIKLNKMYKKFDTGINKLALANNPYTLIGETAFLNRKKINKLISSIPVGYRYKLPFEIGERTNELLNKSTNAITQGATNEKIKRVEATVKSIFANSEKNVTLVNALGNTVRISDNGYLRTLLEELGDENSVLVYLKNHKPNIVAPMYNSAKKEFYLKRYIIDNIDDLRVALNDDAWVLTKSNYNTVFKNMVDTSVKNVAVRLFKEAVGSAFKSTVLAHVGTTLRNFLDAVGIKNPAAMNFTRGTYTFWDGLVMSRQEYENLCEAFIKTIDDPDLQKVTLDIVGVDITKLVQELERLGLDVSHFENFVKDYVTAHNFKYIQSLDDLKRYAYLLGGGSGAVSETSQDNIIQYIALKSAEQTLHNVDLNVPNTLNVDYLVRDFGQLKVLLESDPVKMWQDYIDNLRKTAKNNPALEAEYLLEAEHQEALLNRFKNIYNDFISDKGVAVLGKKRNIQLKSNLHELFNDDLFTGSYKTQLYKYILNLDTHKQIEYKNIFSKEQLKEFAEDVYETIKNNKLMQEFLDQRYPGFIKGINNPKTRYLWIQKMDNTSLVNILQADPIFRSMQLINNTNKDIRKSMIYNYLYNVVAQMDESMFTSPEVKDALLRLFTIDVSDAALLKQRNLIELQLSRTIKDPTELLDKLVPTWQKARDAMNSKESQSILETFINSNPDLSSLEDVFKHIDMNYSNTIKVTEGKIGQAKEIFYNQTLWYVVNKLWHNTDKDAIKDYIHKWLETYDSVAPNEISDMEAMQHFFRGLNDSDSKFRASQKMKTSYLDTTERMLSQGIRRWETLDSRVFVQDTDLLEQQIYKELEDFVIHGNKAFKNPTRYCLNSLLNMAPSKGESVISNNMHTIWEHIISGKDTKVLEFKSNMEEYITQLEKQLEILPTEEVLNNYSDAIRKIVSREGDNAYGIPLLNWFSDVEAGARTSLMQNAILNKGYSLNEATDLGILTHFDYSTKPKWLNYVESIVPFATYPIENTKWWLEQILEKNPRLLSNYIDFNKYNWDIPNRSEYELEKNKALLNNYLTGNINLSALFNKGNQPGKTDLVFKSGMSLYDMLGLLSTPIDAIEQRQIVPYSVRTAINLLPFGSTAASLYNNYNYAKNSDSNLYKFAKTPIISSALTTQYNYRQPKMSEAYKRYLAYTNGYQGKWARYSNNNYKNRYVNYIKTYNTYNRYHRYSDVLKAAKFYTYRLPDPLHKTIKQKQYEYNQLRYRHKYIRKGGYQYGL